MIWCIWYPSGGFGHFLNAVISLRGHNFVRPSDANLTISANGNSHALELVAPKYLHDPDHYEFEFDCDQHYTVLIDNGIDNTGDRFLKFFPGANVVKMIYSDWSWPVVAYTNIAKAMQSSLAKELPTSEWQTNDDWAQREKYFLFLRDHEFRTAWTADSRCVNIDVHDLCDYHNLKSTLCTHGIDCDDFESLWQQWHDSNSKYFEPIQQAKKIIKAVSSGQSTDISHITDLWSQAVIYYYIWLCYQFEVPHNDYANWFTSTADVATMLESYGIKPDTHKFQ